METNNTTAIHLEACFATTPECVYELLTNGAKFGDVTGRPGKGGGMEGAYFSLFGGWLEGRQVELVAGKRIVQAWRFAEWEPGVYSVVRFTLEPEAGKTKLIVDQCGHPAQYHEHLATNWKPFYFDPLEKHFSKLN
jgi:activator of HSP90 ATPase